MKQNLLFAFACVMAIALFVYGGIGLLNESYSLKNILSVSAGFIGFLGFLYKIIRDGKEDQFKLKNKREDIFRKLSQDYEKFKGIKTFINENLDRNGNLKEARYRKKNNRPSQVDVEDFMRFFKNLKWEIDNGNISWKTAKEKFSKYALLVHQYEFFRPGIEDYASYEWRDFRDYCEYILHMD